MKVLSLRSNFSWTLAGNVMYAASQWGMLVILAQMVPPAEVGRFVLGLTISAPVVLLFNLALRNVQATDATGAFAFGDYLGLRLLTTASALLITIGIALAIGYPRYTLAVIVAVTVAKSFEAISDVVYGFLQQHEQMSRVGKSLILRGAFSIIALSIGTHFTGTVLGGVIGFGATWMIVLIFYDLPSARAILLGSSARVDPPPSGGVGRRLLYPRGGSAVLGRLVRVSLPLGAAAMFVSLTANIPRFVLERYWSEKELGIFAAVTSLMMVGSTIVTAIGQAASPRMARLYALGELVAYRRLLLRILAVCVLIGAAGILLSLVAGRELLLFLYGEVYARQSEVLVWVMVAGALSIASSCLVYGAIAARSFSAQVPLFLAVVVSSGVASAVLIPTAGVPGAALALVISMLVQLVGSALLAGRVLRRTLPRSMKAVGIGARGETPTEEPDSLPRPAASSR